MKIIIATIKAWNIEKAEEIRKKYLIEHEIKIIDRKEALDLRSVSRFNPDYIFFPHWSYIIPPDIYENYTCVVFHMTDLPFGRGGSPLQNLIIRGIRETSLSAIKVEEGIDSGPIYFKETLSLDGSAEEIYKRAADQIFSRMIPLFLEKADLQPVKQEGEPVYFKRRTVADSELNEDMSLSQIYNHIRMLDAEGYPNAYISFGKYKLTLRKARFDGTRIQAEADIVMTEEGEWIEYW